MTIAEMRMLGRKINEANAAKATVEITPVSVVPNTKSVKEVVRESVTNENYVIIDDIPAPVEETVKPKRKFSIRKFFSRKKDVAPATDEVIGEVFFVEDTLVDTQTEDATVDSIVVDQVIEPAADYTVVNTDDAEINVIEVKEATKEPKKKGKGLRAGKKESGTANVGLNLSEVM